MKDTAKNTINKYLPSLEIETKRVQLKNLPLIYEGLYSFERMDVSGKSFLVIEVKDETLGPKDFKKHGRVLKDKLDYPQIWYLKNLHFNKVQRMIRNELNFVIKDKQVYLPLLNTSIKAENTKNKIRSDLTSLSVSTLIRQILLGDLTRKSKVEISELLGSSKMTAGRAIEPLLAHQLCEEQKVGVAKKVHFKNREVLWSFLRDEVKGPIKETIFIDKVPKELPYSGVSALSKLSILMDEELPIFASSKKFFNKKYPNTKEVLEDDAQARVELWDREPTLLEDGHINVIDLYLVLKDEDDERVQIELESLLGKFDLKMG